MRLEVSFLLSDVEGLVVMINITSHVANAKPEEVRMMKQNILKGLFTEAMKVGRDPFVEDSDDSVVVVQLGMPPKGTDSTKVFDALRNGWTRLPGVSIEDVSTIRYEPPEHPWIMDGFRFVVAVDGTNPHLADLTRSVMKNAAAT